MGNYITFTEVWETLINFSAGPTPRVGNDQVEEHIAGIEGQVNGILLARGYAPIPAVDAGAVAVIREQVRRKVAVLVYLELNQPRHSPDWCRSWDIDFSEWLTRLRKGQEKLPGGATNPVGDVMVGSFSLGLTQPDTDT